jgi:hypothetical protein
VTKQKQKSECEEECEWFGFHAMSILYFSATLLAPPVVETIVEDPEVVEDDVETISASNGVRVE